MEKEEKIKLFSRKNKVILVNSKAKQQIEKFFADEEKFKNEIRYNSHLLAKGIKVANIQSFRTDDLCIIYEYIEGKLLLECLEEENEESFRIMGKYLRDFHQILKTESETVLVGDANLRNFILKDNTIIPIDYEDYKTGEAVEDTSSFLSHLASHRNMEKSIRLTMGRTFLKSYYEKNEIPENLTKLAIAKAEKIAYWRKIGKLEKEIETLIENMVRSDC